MSEHKIRVIKADDMTINFLQSCGIGVMVAGNPRLSFKDRIIALIEYFNRIHNGKSYPDDLQDDLVRQLLEFKRANGMDDASFLKLILKHADLIGLKRTLEANGKEPPPILNSREEDIKIYPRWMTKKIGGPKTTITVETDTEKQRQKERQEERQKRTPKKEHEPPGGSQFPTQTHEHVEEQMMDRREQGQVQSG